MHGLQHAIHLLADGCLIRLFDGQGIGHVFKHGHVRPHGVALEHHADVALFRRQKDLVAGYNPVVKAHGAAGGLFKARDDAQHGGFAAAGGAQQGNEFAIFKDGVKVFQYNGRAKGLGDILNGYAGHGFFLPYLCIKWRTRPW